MTLRALLIGAIVCSLMPAAALASTPRDRSRILYASDWLGPTQIFAVDPSGQAPLAQVTFDRNFDCKSTTFACGFTRPTPSPNGRRVAYGEIGVTYDAGWLRERSLWIADADGRHAVKLLPGCCAVWSPDSRRLAYAQYDGRDLHWHVVRADGTQDRVAAGEPPWLEKARQQHLRSPNGRFIAESIRGAILINGRVVANEPGFSLSWSPDSRQLAYVSGVRRANGTNDEESATGDVKVVTVTGRVRTVVDGRGAIGGQIDSLAWTRVPAKIVYRSPEKTDGVFAGGPVQRLVADGSRVAYSACFHVYAWAPATGQPVQVDGRTEEQPYAHCRSPENRLRVYDLAIAGDRMAWGEGWFGNSWEEELIAARLGPPIERATLGHAASIDPSVEAHGGRLLGALAAAGNTLVFGAWETPWDSNAAAYVTTTETLYRASLAGCPCPAITYAAAPRGEAPLVVTDTDGERLVVLVRRGLRILDPEGGELLAIPVDAAAAHISSESLVVLVRGALRVYDASTGQLLRTWPVPDATVGRDCTYFSEPHAARFGSDVCPGTAELILEDATDRWAAYLFENTIHVVDLSIVLDRALAYGSRARFMNDGLALADGARVRLIPYSSLAQP